MNYQTLFSTLFEAAQSLGFAPTHSSELHSTLLRKGFPIASFSPVEVVAAEGVKEPVVEYGVEVKLMYDNVVNGPLRLEAFSSLMDSAERFVAHLREACGVVDVTILGLAPERRVLTVAGECAVGLKMRVKMMECKA